MLKDTPYEDSAQLATAFASVRLSLDGFGRMLRAIYEGPFERTPWSSALAELQEVFSANWVSLVLRLPSEAGNALIINAGPNGVELGGGEFGTSYAFATDPFTGHLPQNSVATVDEVIGHERWTRSDFFREFVQPYGIRYLMGADVQGDEGAVCVIRICRAESTGDFELAEKSLLQVLVPHLRKAMSLYANLGVTYAERALYAGTVDRMLVGALMLDETGTIVAANDAAKSILAENDGLMAVDGQLRAVEAAEQAELQRLLHDAVASLGRAQAFALNAVAISRPSGRSKLGVLVRGIPTDAWSDGRKRPVVAVFIRDIERHSRASQEQMRQLFDLTPAETELAMQLIEGISLEEASVRLGIRKNTARAQLRSIFSKTGVTRQTALVHLMLRSVATLN